MILIRGIKQMSAVAGRAKARGQSIGFVPTMGALHQAHLSLIRRARKENDFTVVSIFVNPAQFSPAEDFKKYPRNLSADTLFCKKEGVDVVFCPAAGQMYPKGFRSYITPEGLSGLLCGKSRPRHFKGVATVVVKLFNIIGPDTAYFGQKDVQQAVIIKRLVCDLNIPVKIKVMPVIRDKDGLALSSRNVYLSRQERQDALILYQSLKHARRLIKKGIRDSGRVISEIRRLVNRKNTARIDYVSVVDPGDLKPVKRIKSNCLIALAVWLGKTRLIDNIVITKAQAKV
ncbi:MAG: pantoate--beta-alanine ligase [Candidatus Omnitrophota bacterium]